MPFDFDSYAAKIAEMEPWELAAEKQKYTRSVSGSTVSSFASLLLGPFAPIGIALSASSIANAGVKLDMINDEMQSQGAYASTRCRDILGGAAISVATAGLGHGVSHVANQAITHATHHALTHGQQTFTHRLGHSTEKGVQKAIEMAIVKHSDSEATMAITTGRICDVCYRSVSSEYAHCNQCADFDYCFTCYYKYRDGHTSGHTFDIKVDELDGIFANLVLARGGHYD